MSDNLPRSAEPQRANILRLCISPGHNFFGHHGQPPGTHPMLELPEIDCLAGRGIPGDRFFDYKQPYKGQITFFAFEVYLELCQTLERFDREPSVFRRNVLVQGLQLNALIGQEFEIQGVRFRGTEECKPCYWMDQAFAPGAEAFLRGEGGLRAVLLTDGKLRTRPHADSERLGPCSAPAGSLVPTETHFPV